MKRSTLIKMSTQENCLDEMFYIFDFFSTSELTMPTLVCFIWLFSQRARVEMTQLETNVKNVYMQ